MILYRFSDTHYIRELTISTKFCETLKFLISNIRQ